MLFRSVVGLGWMGAMWAYGPSFTALRVAVLGTVLLGIALTDARHYLIPDGFTVFGFAFVLVTAVVGVFLGGESPFAGPWESLIGACAGAGAIAIAGWLGEWALKREAMGFGDVTLMAVVGGALGPGRALLVIFLGALIGAVAFLAVVYPLVRIRGVRQSGGQLDLGLTQAEPELPEVPFGVFLAPAALLTLLWGDALVEWYLRAVTTL